MLKTSRPSLNAETLLHHERKHKESWSACNVISMVLGLALLVTAGVLRFSYAKAPEAVVVAPTPTNVTATAGPSAAPTAAPTTGAATPPPPVFGADVDNVLGHLKNFETIAIAHERSRAVRLGYNDSAKYVYDQLAATGQCVGGPRFQYFTAPVHEFGRASMHLHVVGLDSPLELKYDVDFKSPRYNGHGTDSVTTDIVEVAGACAPEDWNPAETEGKVVIVQSKAISDGKCSWFDAAKLAETQGKAAVVLVAGRFGFWGRVRPDGWEYSFADPWSTLVKVPVFTISDLAYALIAKYLAAAPAAAVAAGALDTTTAAAPLTTAAPPLVTASVAWAMETVLAPTMNVLCDAPAASADDIVVVGAHLDSVVTAPGMDDNGSGSSSILEIALQLLTGVRDGSIEQPKNTIRFAWWGAEEIGLIGSYWYARTLSPEDKAKHVLNINHDMLGAQNYRIGVHGARNVTDDIDPDLLRPNLKIQGTYEEYYASIGQEIEVIPMTGGSDFLPFLRSGIPAGGINTGVTALKTVEQQRKFGGLVHYPHDICYHRDCDDFAGISRKGLNLCANAAAYSTYKYAMQPDIRAWLRED